MTNMDGDNVTSRHVHVHAPDEEYGFEDGADEVTKVGRRRQVIGILVRIVFCRVARKTTWVLIVLVAGQVLQLGIMIHSLVIGLTLSISRGSEFSA